MQKMKDFLVYLSNSGYNEPVFDHYEQEITLQNNRMTSTTSFIGTFIMALLTIASLFMPSVSKVLPLYFATTIMFLINYLFSRKYGNKNRVVAILCNYSFLSVAFFFAIGLDIIQMNPTATTVCVLLVALPLFIVDNTLREMNFFLVISILFILESFFIKQSPKAPIDALNAVVFFIVGAFLGYKHNHMVLRNMINQRLLVNQRDQDTLTTLYNKGAIEYKAVEFLHSMNVTASMMIIDMDNFKYVNDTYGHHSGDEILVKISHLLLSLFRASDLISRFGGDEFIIFLPMMADKAVLEEKAKAILKGVSEIRIEADDNYRAQVCIGIASYNETNGSYEELFQQADEAMYQVKRRGKNGFSFYDNQTIKVLVVDDIEMTRAIWKKILSQDYEILEAVNGQDALDVLSSNRDIKLVLTDIVMPVMDGYELIQKIRKEDCYDDVAIIACTQFGDKDQEKSLFELGVNDFIYKASSPSLVKMRVKNVIGSIR